MSDHRRLIEEELPLREVNAASKREKSLRHGHISTLHLWWARRPLAMSRAVVLGTLLPDPADAAERDRICELIADASQFEASIQPHRIGPLKDLIAKAYPDGPPKVLDCFAGGGAIPLEALRLGCDTTALDLNPVAHLIERCVLEYPQRFGQPDAAGRNPLGDALLQWAEWVKHRAALRLAEVFPTNGRDGRPAVYFWCRTMVCPNPACRAEIPLLSSRRLADSSRQTVWLRLTPHTDPIGIEVVYGPIDGADVKEGTVRASSVTCPRCGSTTAAADVRAYGNSKGFGNRLYATLDRGVGRGYRHCTQDEIEAISARLPVLVDALEELPDGTSPLPDEAVDDIGYRNLQHLPFGYATWRSLFNDRQLYVLGVLCETVRDAHAEMQRCGFEPDFCAAVATYLGLCVDRVADRNSTFSTWDVSRESVRGTFADKYIPMAWDYCEIDPFGTGSGSWDNAVRWIERVIRHCSTTGETPAIVNRGSAQALPFPDNSFDAVAVDPPYYYSVMYSDLSDFFYVWLKRSVGHLFPDLFSSQWTPKAQEVIQNRVNPSNSRHISGEEFETRLERSLGEIARVLKDDGVVSIVFAHTDVDAWERLLRALRAVDLVVTTSWPMRSEMANRPLAQVKAALGSSVVLTCRAARGERQGFYDDVVRELDARIAERLDAFEEMGLTGADYFISAVGPAFEVFARYSSIVRLSGEEVDVSDLMVLARQVVARRAMRQLLGDEPLWALDGQSLFYLTWRWAYLTAELPADEAYKLERAFDVDMSDLERAGGLVTRSGSTFKLLGPHERRDLELAVSPRLIDVLHAACRFWDAGRRQELADLLGATGMGGEPSFWAVARVLGEVLPEESRERRLLLGLGGNRDALEQAAEESTATAEELHLFDPGFDLVLEGR